MFQICYFRAFSISLKEKSYNTLRLSIKPRLTVKTIIPKANKNVIPETTKDIIFQWINDSFHSLQESFPGYDPPLYTAQEIQASPPGADPDILQ